MADQRVKVAHLHWGFPPTIGGVETHLSILLPELVKRGHPQWMLTAAIPEAPERYCYHGVEVVRRPFMELKRISADHSSIPKEEVEQGLRAFLDEAGPDVIHAHNLHYFTRQHAEVLAAEAKRRSVPLILTAHNIWNEIIFVDLTACFPWDHMIAVSHFIKREIAGFGVDEGRITVIHHGIDTDTFQARTDLESLYRKYPRLRNRRVLLHPARISLGKGGDISLKAVHIIRKYIPEVMLVLAGAGNIIDWDRRQEGDMEYFSRLVHILGLQDHVYLDAFAIEQMAELYNLAEVCIYPSSSLEPFGLTMLEAQASEKPMVVSRVGGMPEIIHDGINGYVVNVRDHETLAQRVVMLMQDEALRLRLGRVGRKNVLRHFNKEIMTEETLAVYRQVLDGKSKRSGGNTG
ncbi:glycosyltransferase family 4 protein [candidate division FCPU426 bacterium]|nr:glycosyltransferase family 4 protein [candidate division FCPU426 bacterium]